MTIQYPNKLDPTRKVYFAIDNIYGGTGSPTSADRKIQNNIVTKLKAAGLNVVKSAMGPGTLYDNMKTVYNNGDTNSIIFNVVNGVDPSNIREVAVNGNDNRGRTVRARGNDAVLGYMWDSCDPTPGGRCADHVRGSETGGGMRNPGPAQYMVNNKIYAIAACSDERTKTANADYTGDKIAQKFIDLFDWDTNDNNTPSITPNVTPSVTPDDTNDTNTTNKTISTRTITKYYTSAYYEEILKAKTDNNGAFRVLPKLPYKGKYKVHIRYGGDKTHNSATQTNYIYNFSRESATFKEKLLQTTTITTYTDGTSTNTTTGSIGNEKHLRKEITTEKYENGTLKETTTKTVNTDDIIEINSNPETDGSTSNSNDSSTTNTIPDTDTNTGTKVNPFSQNLPLLNGVPDVARMAINNKEFEMVNLTKCYVLSEAQFKAVYNRDSRILQVNNYKNSKYTFFETSSSEKYVVLERERWNCIEESVHAYMVEYRTNTWPKFINVDFNNRRTLCYTSESDVVREIANISDEDYRNAKYPGAFEHWWDGNNNYLTTRNYHWLSDLQNTGYTCGPTAASMCLQVLHCYISEHTMASKCGTTSGGSSPEGLKDGLEKVGLKAWVVSSNIKNTAKTELEAGRPYLGHMVGHYYMLGDLFYDHNRVLVGNSSSISSGPSPGWHSWSDLTTAFARAGVKMQLNYTISEQEKQELLHFVASMGGSWTRPYNTEVIRKYR